MTDKEKSLFACGFSAIAIIFILIVAAFLNACTSGKKATLTSLPIVPIENTTETKIIHTERIDTIFIEIPSQSAERTTPDKFSHLETDYAESNAKINEDGTLTHNLKNKPQPKPVPVKNSTDTIYRDRNIEKPIPVEVPIEVERELTWWQKKRLDTWGWLIAALALALAWNFRRPLLNLVGRLLKKLP